MTNNNNNKIQYIEDRLLEYANLFENTARHIKNGHLYSDDFQKRMRKLLSMLDEYKFLDDR
jgi:hypothetical protein